MGKKMTINQQGQTVQGSQQNIGEQKIQDNVVQNTGEIKGSNFNVGNNNTQIIGDSNAQTITARDINFGTVNNQAEFVKELKKLQQELNTAIEKKVFPNDIKFDVGSRMSKAVKQAEKSEPEGILKHLGKLGGLVSGVNAAVELLKSINDAKDKVTQIFQ